MLSPSVKRLIDEQVKSGTHAIITVPIKCYRRTRGTGALSRVTNARMEDYASETDSDYTSYWRDWVGQLF